MLVKYTSYIKCFSNHVFQTFSFNLLLASIELLRSFSPFLRKKLIVFLVFSWVKKILHVFLQFWSKFVLPLVPLSIQCLDHVNTSPTLHPNSHTSGGPLSHQSGALRGWGCSFGNRGPGDPEAGHHWWAIKRKKNTWYYFSRWRGVLTLFLLVRNGASGVKYRISPHLTCPKSRQTGFLNRKTLRRTIAVINQAPSLFSTHAHSHLRAWLVAMTHSARDLSLIWGFFPVGSL